MKPRPNEIICYHCQQSAEKFLKGYLASINESVKKTHDLQFLCHLAAHNTPSILDIEEDCIELTDYSVQVRYPFHMDIEDSDVIQALKSANKIKDFILKLKL